MTYQLGTECVSTFDFNQFQPGESMDQCGPAAVSLVHFAGESGKAPSGTAQDAIKLMAQLYLQFIGPNIPSDTGGTTNATLYKLILAVGNHYQNLYPDAAINGTDTQFGCPQWTLKNTIRAWCKLGYPVIIGVTEDSVLDMGLHRRPYDWVTAGLSHIITVTGVAANNIDILVRDTANLLAPGPREYAVTPLVLLNATVVVPGAPMWLPRPVDAYPEHMLPPAPVPAPTPTLAQEIAQLEADVTKVQQDVAKVAQMAPGAPARTAWNGVGTPMPWEM